jgi:hypothetical protein
MPSVGFNVSGAGLAVRFVETTDADELHAEVSCGAPYADLSCPCRSCSTDTGEACNTDLDCQHQRGACSLAAGLQKALCDETADCKGIDVGPCSSLTDRCRSATSIACESNSDCSNVDAGDCLPSTCSARGNGVNTMPNQCEDGLCSATGENQGRCETGPDIKYCDYAVTSDGEGVIPCLSDEDCIPPFIEVVGGNHCTMVQRLACFPDPIVTTGASDPGHPLTSAAFCMSAGTNVGKSEAFGLPGPVRLHRQLAMRSLCAADHDQSYEPGFGGCP